MEAITTIIAAQARKPNSGLIVMPDPFPFVNRAEITSLAMRHRLPVVYSNRGYTEVGGLLSYGADLVENLRGAASYTDRILRGDKPRELPIQVPIKFELVINLKTAKAIGLEVPATAARPRRRGDRIACRCQLAASAPAACGRFC